MPIIKANNINIYYEIHGQGQPIVFVAGFSGDHTCWRSIIKEYTNDYQVIIFDNRGIGKSDCPDYPYTTEMMADDTAALIKDLNLGAVYLVGCSFGGCIVQMIAHKYPELIRSAVISNAFPEANMRVSLYADIRLELIKANTPQESIVKFITLMCWSNKYLSKPGMVEKLVRDGFYPITIKGYEGQLHAAKTFNSRDWLKDIKVPFLVMASDDDLLVSVKEIQNIAKSIPNAEYFCFEDVGHVPFIETPEIFNKKVLSFIERFD